MITPRSNYKNVLRLQADLTPLLVGQARTCLFTQWPGAQHLHWAVGVVTGLRPGLFRPVLHRLTAKAQHFNGDD